MIKLWCFDEGPGHEWGVNLAKKAQELGHDARLFDDPHEPDEGYVFFHMHHHPSVRLYHKRAMAYLAVNPDIKLIPDYRASVLYDDKLEQARQLSKWMPRTRIFYAPRIAKAYIEQATYPFYSKSSEGASSHNVRLVADQDQARQEVRAAFSDIGIKNRYNQTQRGYLLWQEAVPRNEEDVRIIACGSKRLILRRRNKDPLHGEPNQRARLTPITELGHELYTALAYANEFFAEERMGWGGIDLVRDKESDDRWLLLECTVGWTLHGYYECGFFNQDGSRDPRMGSDIWGVLLDEIAKGAFG